MSLYYKMRSKVRSNIKFIYWRIFTPINKFFNISYRPNFFFSVEVSNVCNLKCVFCGYQKFKGHFKIKDQHTFESNIDQIAKITDKNITLTPLTGDVFTDKKLFSKLNYLELHPGISEYTFTTNFTLCNESDIEKLLRLKKIDHLKISIYGHDSDSFKKITKSNTYNKLINNLNYLYKNIQKLNFKIDFAVRSYMDFSFEKYASTDLISLILNIEKSSHLTRKSHHYHYTNWGGDINKDDIGDLDIILKDARNSFKNGPCNRLYSFLISANNEVVLCACRDTHRYMKIGSLANNNLNEIINYNNPLYKSWIDDQEKNIFNGPCKACDMYEPIYAKPLHLFFKKQTKKLFQS